jgi:ABC-2 type transport system permease protein
MSLARAGTFLVRASAVNRVRLAARKLREPRYLVGAAALGLYLASLVGRSALRGEPDADLVQMQQAAGVLRLGLELVLTLIGGAAVWSTWTLGKDRLSFSFTEAEATWLLSGPVSRRGVVRYKVAVGLLRTLLSALLATLIFRRGMASAPVPLVLGSWLGFSLLWLHGATASLVRIRWKQSGVSLSRRLLVGTLFPAAFVLLAGLAVMKAGPRPWLEALPASAQALPASALAARTQEWFRALAAEPSIAWALVPARAFAGAVFARSLGQALKPLGVLLLLDAALLCVVLLLDVPLEEAALASAERRARLEARRRRRGLPQPRVSGTVRLGALGRPEFALAWKNWLALRRVYGARLGLILLMVGVGLGSALWGVFHRGSAGTTFRLLGAAFVAGLAATTVLIGPVLFRTDLRSDLRRLDVLRTLPLSGLQVVRGELLAPAVLLGLTEVALLVLALGLSAGTPLPGFPFTSRLAWVAGAALLLPAATAAVLVVQNAAALVFPSLLVDDEETAPRGVEAAGTRLLNLGATLLLLLLGFLPGAVLGLLVGAGARLLGLGPFSYTLACGAVAAVLASEVALALRFMGRGLEHLDPTTA